jgi:hypothetical protein
MRVLISNIKENERRWDVWRGGPKENCVSRPNCIHSEGMIEINSLC